MAACLMLSGVGKSGSPAPKSTTSTPSERSFSASEETFMVEETLMEEIRSAIWLSNACIAFSYTSLNWIRLLDPGLEPLFNQRRYQSRDIAAKRDHFFHQPGADERVSFVGHHEDGLDFGAQPAI